MGSSDEFSVAQVELLMCNVCEEEDRKCRVDLKSKQARSESRPDIGVHPSEVVGYRDTYKVQQESNTRGNTKSGVAVHTTIICVECVGNAVSVCGTKVSRCL